VKRSGRDEPMCFAIHKSMEAMLGISLYSCLYLKLAKTLCLSYYLLCFQQNWRTREWNRFCPERGLGWEVAQTVYTNVNKCKTNKIKRKEKVELVLQ
jgi:hypothetical protein